MTQVTVILERHSTLTAFTAALLLVGVAGFSSCSELSESQTQRVREALDDTLLSSTESYDIEMELMEEGGKTKVRLRGSYAATYRLDEMNETQIDGPVFVQIFDSAGSVKTTATSEWAKYRPEQSEFELFGDVVVRTNDGRRLESEYLKWDQVEDRISTPRFVVVVTPDDSITGNGFEGVNDLSQYTIKNISGRAQFN